ncbi:MAG: hypothetical protein VX964_01135, partial [Verrucomicrobiota bacterium]|nr:hypothetical protein [Verrucomicrobiota bacterium]
MNHKMKTSGCEGLHHGEVLLAHSADKRVEECVTERKVIALSAYDAQRSVGGIQDHYVLKDFETWTGYFAPGKLMIKVLNIAFS